MDDTAHPVGDGVLSEKILLIPMESYIPKLEPGERLVLICGLILIFDSKDNLIYWRLQNGNHLKLTIGTCRLLELLVLNVRHTVTYEQMCQHLYDMQRKQRPNGDYFSTTNRILRDLKKELISKTGNNPIKTHWGIGIMFLP